jgi:AraC family transcriptional regulator
MMAAAAANGSIRIVVGGRVRSHSVVRTPLIRIESFHRDVSRRVRWHFKQPELVLFMYGPGARNLHGRMDGKPFDQTFDGKLALYPAEMEFDAEFKVTTNRSQYTAVFFDPSFVAGRFPCSAAVPRLGFDSRMIASGLQELCAEAENNDDVFAMMAEGWAIQTLGALRRLSGMQAQAGRGGGLSPSTLKKIREYVEANLGASIGLAELAMLAGVSTRHFIRAFTESTGSTPHQYVIARRIDRAKGLLAGGGQSLTDIALATGFSHSQHFASAFKKHTGASPSLFRAALQ